MPKKLPRDPERCTTMEVAALLGVRYQKARDMMLARKFGEPALDPLTVPRTGVEAFKARRKEKVK